MKNYARFIPGEEIDEVAQWRFGAVDTASLIAAAKVPSPEEAAAAQKEAALRQASLDEGFSLGHAEGFEKGYAQAKQEGDKLMSDYIAGQGKALANVFTRLFESAQARLAEADQVIAQGVLELACELAKQVVRQELSVNPLALQPVIQEALHLLVADGKGAVVRLNPIDLAVMQEGFHANTSATMPTWVADAAVARGGCLVESAGTVVDGQLEKRWQRAVANLGVDVPWQEPADHG